MFPVSILCICMACLSPQPESQASDASECREIKTNNDLFRATIGILCSKNGWQIIEHAMHTKNWCETIQWAARTLADVNIRSLHSSLLKLNGFGDMKPNAAKIWHTTWNLRPPWRNMCYMQINQGRLQCHCEGLWTVDFQYAGCDSADPWWARLYVATKTTSRPLLASLWPSSLWPSNGNKD